MKILITGGTGFLGSNLSSFFLDKKYHVTILTRKNNLTNHHSNINYITDLDISNSYDVVINLAGEPLDKNRWNEKVKQNLIKSRINTTSNLIKYFKETKIKPKLFISASAIGFYDDTQNQISEYSKCSYHKESFAQTLCKMWEEEALKANEFGIRTCITRIGVVLGNHNGSALEKLKLSFKLGLGSTLGSGNQFMSWIHIKDFVRATDHFINNTQLSGPFNLVAPNPVTNYHFSKILAKAMNRPCIFNIPKFIVKLIFGDMAQELLLSSKNIEPKRLLESNFKFSYNDLKTALQDLLNQLK